VSKIRRILAHENRTITTVTGVYLGILILDLRLKKGERGQDNKVSGQVFLPRRRHGFSGTSRCLARNETGNNDKKARDGRSDVLRGVGARGPGLFADKATIIRCSGDSLSSEQMRHLESHRCEFFEGVLADSPTL
jgi:hypothetical protein